MIIGITVGTYLLKKAKVNVFPEAIADEILDAIIPQQGDEDHGHPSGFNTVGHIGNSRPLPCTMQIIET